MVLYQTHEFQALFHKAVDRVVCHTAIIEGEDSESRLTEMLEEMGSEYPAPEAALQYSTVMAEMPWSRPRIRNEEEMKNSITLAFVTDIHAGELIEYRPGKEALGLLGRFVEHINGLDVDAVIELGDRVNNVDGSHDYAVQEQVQEVLCHLAPPRFSLSGNHDVHYVTKEDNQQITGMPSSYYSSIVSNFRLIFIDTADPVQGHCGGYVSAPQLDWLKGEVAMDTLPTLVFGHHPIIDQNQEGNPFFVDLPGEEKIGNSGEVLEILLNGKNVKAYFNGHVHWFYASREQSIRSFSIPSLLESYPLKEHAPGRYALATISHEGMVDLSLHTLCPMRTLGRIVL